MIQSIFYVKWVDHKIPVILKIRVDGSIKYRYKRKARVDEGKN